MYLSVLSTINREIFVSTKFQICNFHVHVQIFLYTNQPSENLWQQKFSVLNFLLTHGITGRPSKLNLLQRSCEDHHAFVVAIAYGIQLLEKELCNEADQHHSNRHRVVSDLVASMRKHLKACPHCKLNAH